MEFFSRIVLATFVVLILLLGCSQRKDRIVSVAVHPTKPNIIYVATEEGVYKTRDGGRIWNRLTEGLRRIRVMNLIIDPRLPANVFAGTLADGVYKSPDGGHRWLPRNKGIQKGMISANVNHLAFNPNDTQILYAATTVGVFCTKDGGQSWMECMRGMTEINFVVAIAVDAAHSNIIYAGTSGGVYRSFDGAQHWMKINHGLVPDDAKMASMALGINVLAVDHQTPDKIFAGTTRGLFITENKGELWSKVSTIVGEPYISCLLLDPRDTSRMYLGTSAGLWKSEDGGNHWVAKNEGLKNQNIRSIAMDLLDPSILYLGTNGAGLFKSNDAANSWNHLSLKLDSR